MLGKSFFLSMIVNNIVTKILGIQWGNVASLCEVILFISGIIFTAWKYRKFFLHIVKYCTQKLKVLQAKFRKRWERLVGIEDKNKEIEALKQQHTDEYDICKQINTQFFTILNALPYIDIKNQKQDAYRFVNKLYYIRQYDRYKLEYEVCGTENVRYIEIYMHNTSFARRFGFQTNRLTSDKGDISHIIDAYTDHKEELTFL